MYKTFTRKHFRVNSGNVSAWVNGFAWSLTFLVWIDSPLRGSRGESTAPGVGHHNGLYGHRNRVCRSRQPCPDARPLVTDLYVMSSRATTKSEQKR